MPSEHGPMACPVDGATLVMSERSGIEIDYCPTCRGVWLDRGELDKIIERASADLAPQQQAQPAQAAPQAPYPAQPADPYGYDRGGHHGRGHHGFRRRKGFLHELFD